MRRNRAFGGLGVIAIAAVVGVGLSQAPRGSSPSKHAPSGAQAQAALAGSPPPLAALHEQANQLLRGGMSAVHARLAGLRGHPIVLNKWASWCGPCRLEFPFFAQAYVSYGRRVGFVGLDSADNDSNASSFLRDFPVSYPSYTDPSGQTGTAVTKSTFFPVTVFYDSAGHQTYVHQGQYRTQDQLSGDVRRYALGA